MQDPESIIQPIRKAQRRQTRSMLAILVGLLLLGGYVAKGTTETVKSLCALRADLRTQAKTSEDFLAKHPEGIPGITPATIRAGIVRQRRTARALRSLSCEGSFPVRLL